MKGHCKPLLPIALVLVGIAASACDPGSPSIPVSRARGEPDGLLLIDFAERAAAGHLRSDGSHCEFDDTSAHECLMEGWSRPEDIPGAALSFAWAIDLTASVRLRVFDRDSQWLHFRSQPPVLERDLSQTVVVRVNDIEVGAVELPPGGFTSHTLRVPEAARRTGEHIVSFSFGYTESLRNRVPTTADARPVAAAFDYVAVTSMEEPPHPRALDAEVLTYRTEGDHLVQPTGSESAFRLTIPPDGLLEFNVRDPLDTRAQGTTGLRTQVSLRRSPDVEEVFFNEPSGRGETRWRADLSAFAGEDVELVFRAVGGSFGTQEVEWLRPRLYGDTGSIDVTTNVVLIVVDTLRADHLGVYGGVADTPNMDALAASGVMFERAYSHVPITVPSHSSMFTSLLPAEHAANNNSSVLGEQHLTLAERLRHTTYRHTAGFVSLGVLTQEFGLAQGFTEYHDAFGIDWWKTAEELNAELLPWLRQHPPAPFFLWAHYSDPHSPYAAPGRAYPRLEASHGTSTLRTFAADGRTTSIRLDAPPGATLVQLAPAGDGPQSRIVMHNLRTSADEFGVTCSSGCRESQPAPNVTEHVTGLPATLTVTNPTDVQRSTSILVTASEYLPIQDAQGRYRDEVEYVDREIGRLLSTLRTTVPSPGSTLVILTADHGEELGEHDTPGHVAYLYDSTLRVPLIVSWPGRLPAGHVVSDAVSHIDLLPTALDLLDVPDHERRSGRSLVPLMTGRRVGDADTAVIAETFRPEAAKDRQAIISGRHKLIVTPADQAEELYQLDQDPDEQDNRATREPDVTTRLRMMLRVGLEQAKSRAAMPEERPLTQEDLDRLRSLGYVR